MATNQDLVFFRWIWDNRPHISEVSGKPLSYDFNKAMLFCFAHVLTKKAYPGIRHNPYNIVLMTNEEHSMYDNWTHKAKEDPRFDWVFILRQTLIKSYYEWKNCEKNTQAFEGIAFEKSLQEDQKDLYQIRPKGDFILPNFRTTQK